MNSRASRWRRALAMSVALVAIGFHGAGAGDADPPADLSAVLGIYFRPMQGGEFKAIAMVLPQDWDRIAKRQPPGKSR